MSGGILVLSAPSGTGKTSVARALVRESPAFEFSVSATTRSPRGEEVHGVDYHFVTDDEFDRLVGERALLEWASVHGRRYGSLVSEVDRIVSSGSFAVLDIDVQGALQVRERAPEALLVFLLPPSGAELAARLRGRGTDQADQIRRRLETALEELDRAEQFDYSVVNRDLSESVEAVRRIAEADGRSIRRDARFADTIARLKSEIEDVARRAAS